MSMFLDKTFMDVKGDLETIMGYLKKGLVVQNDSYMPIQKNFGQIAKCIKNIETSLKNMEEEQTNIN